MKIKLPNPEDYVNDIMGFLDQMELCIHHAKKSAEKILSKYSPEDIEKGEDTPWIEFASPYLENLPGFCDSTNSGIEKRDYLDPDQEWRHDLELEIVEL